MKNLHKDIDKIEGSSGLAKLIHVLLWPVRKFYITIPLITLALVTPIFFGKKVTEIPMWYKEKTIAIYEAAPEFFVENYYNIKEKLGFEVDPAKRKKFAKSKKPQENVSKNVLAEAPKRRTTASKRTGFEISKDSDIPRIAMEIETGEVIETSDYEDIVAYVPKNGNASRSNDAEAFRIKPSSQKLKLIYLRTPKVISGTATVKSANEIEINNTYIVLYGIYANPNTLKGAQARAYLEIKAKRDDIKCYIVARTYKDVSTGICFSGKENINKSLVLKGYSENVALDM